MAIGTMVRRCRTALACCICIFLAGSLLNTTVSAAVDCDAIPTGVEKTDYSLPFEVPAGLMPDPQFDGLQAHLEVHRVRPVFADKCAALPSRAAVLVHGRTVAGPVAFDLRFVAPGGGTLSLQESLARSGIDTFAPSLLGYGGSTTFEHGLDDPGNASLRPFLPDGSCPYPEGCDESHNSIFPLDQQGEMLIANSFEGQRRKHSSSTRFANTDVWVRDIAQVVDDAIARAQPTDGKVTLIGYSLGALRVGRALSSAEFPDVVGNIDRVAFLAPFFGGPTEEPPPQGFVTFPLTLAERRQIADGATMATPAREAACAGYHIEGSGEQAWEQLMQLQGNPTGLLRLPTFSSYGFNEAVAGQLTLPTLVIQGLDDVVVPSSGFAVYNALPPSMPNKVLVQLDCATHEMLWERAHSSVSAALIEWVTNGTFDGAQTGSFTVDASGIARPTAP